MLYDLDHIEEVILSGSQKKKNVNIIDYCPFSSVVIFVSIIWILIFVVMIVQYNKK